MGYIVPMEYVLETKIIFDFEDNTILQDIFQSLPLALYSSWHQNFEMRRPIFAQKCIVNIVRSCCCAICDVIRGGVVGEALEMKLLLSGAPNCNSSYSNAW